MSRCDLEKEIIRLRNSERMLLEKNIQLEKRAILDPMTELLNVASFREQFSQYFSERRRTQVIETFAVFWHIDLKEFGEGVNDRYGHEVGDRALRRVAFLLKRHGRFEGNDLLGRLGGDEFGAFISGIRNQPHAPGSGFIEIGNITQRFMMAVEQQEQKDLPDELHLPKGAVLKANIGIVYWQERELAHEAGSGKKLAKEIEKLADTLMYQAKRNPDCNGSKYNHVVVERDHIRQFD